MKEVDLKLLLKWVQEKLDHSEEKWIRTHERIQQNDLEKKALLKDIERTEQDMDQYRELEALLEREAKK